MLRHKFGLQSRCLNTVALRISPRPLGLQQDLASTLFCVLKKSVASLIRIPLILGNERLQIIMILKNNKSQCSHVECARMSSTVGGLPPLRLAFSQGAERS